MENIFEKIKKESGKVCVDYNSPQQKSNEYDTKIFPSKIK